MLILALILFFAGIGFFVYGTYLMIKPLIKKMAGKPLAENGKKLAICAVCGTLLLYWSKVIFDRMVN